MALFGLNTPLGEGELVLASFSGREEMSRLFQFKLELRSANLDVKAADIVGQDVTWSILPEADEPRFFHGFVNRFSAGPADDAGIRTYFAEVVPWLWFLTRTADCRIFQEMKVPDIIEQIFADLGFTKYKLSLQGSYVERDYCVQYRETDFNFVSRLMEEEGIFYFFEFKDGEHTLVLADAKNAYFDCRQKDVIYTRSPSMAFGHIHRWERSHEYRPGKWTHTDYNFETPAADLKAETPTIVDLPNVANYEIYDYPGEYAQKGDGESLVKIRMEEEESTHQVGQGASTCPSFLPGGKFTFEEHHVSAEEGLGYVLTSVQHFGVDSKTSGASGNDRYENSFTCIPDAVVFRPQRITPAPIVQGPHTAVVVGPAGEEIFTDKYGRIKVQFHWDREGKKNEKSSCWMRVSTLWAGKQWGMIHIPRIGHEVIVDFLEGNPDNPIVTGSVYNAANMPPYGLPDNKTQSGVKSRSSLGGGPPNFNEIRFEDKIGSEQVYIHAEKNQDNMVENDATLTVGHDRTKDIGNNETTTIGNDRTETVNNNETITIVGNRTETVQQHESITVNITRSRLVGAAESVTVGAAQSIKVGAAQTVAVVGFRALTVGAYHKIKVIGPQSVTIGKNLTENIKKNHIEKVKLDSNLEVGKNYAVKVKENYNTEVGKDSGHKIKQKFIIDAGQEISIKTGKASILMKEDGTIQIKGKNISMIADDKITGKAKGDMVLKGKNILEN